MTPKIPRGIRNNNPLNIRIGNNWKGEVEHPTDKDFEQFQSMIWGLRAGFILLHRYINRYGLRTIKDIVSRWAPPNENNTSHYAECVSNLTHIGLLDELWFSDKKSLCDIVSAMCLVECGVVVDRQMIEEAYDLVAVS